MSAETPTEEVTTTEETTTKETTTPKTDVKEPKPEVTAETKEATTEETPAEESTPAPIEPVTEESYVSPPKETSPGHKRVLSKHQSAKKEKYGVVFAAKKRHQSVFRLQQEIFTHGRKKSLSKMRRRLLQRLHENKIIN